jgi:hypothetical protein
MDPRNRKMASACKALFQRHLDIADTCYRRRANSCSSTGYCASMRMSALPGIYADS